MARRGSANWAIDNYGKPCVGGDIVPCQWYPDLTKNQINIHDGTQLGWQALGAVMLAYNYKVPTSYVGGYACRNITGGNTKSMHAWPLAMDINAKTNPFIRTPSRRPIKWGVETDMPAAMIREIEMITASSKKFFGWGGRWRTVKDAMHFQVEVTLEEIAVGVEAPRGFYTGDDDLAFLSDEAQKFWEEQYQEQKKELKPPTNKDAFHTLVTHVRDHPSGGKHTHDAQTKVGESK